jgi:hypothetical protein
MLLREPLDDAGNRISGTCDGAGQVRDLAGTWPCDAVSRLALVARRSQGSRPQHVSGRYSEI